MLCSYNLCVPHIHSQQGQTVPGLAGKPRGKHDTKLHICSQRWRQDRSSREERFRMTRSAVAKVVSTRYANQADALIELRATRPHMFRNELALGPLGTRARAELRERPMLLGEAMRSSPRSASSTHLSLSLQHMRWCPASPFLCVCVTPLRGVALDRRSRGIHAFRPHLSDAMLRSGPGRAVRIRHLEPESTEVGEATAGLVDDALAAEDVPDAVASEEQPIARLGHPLVGLRHHGHLLRAGREPVARLVLEGAQGTAARQLASGACFRGASSRSGAPAGQLCRGPS